MEKDKNIINLRDYKAKIGLLPPRDQICAYCNKKYDHWWTSTFYYCYNYGEKHEPMLPDDNRGRLA